MVFCNALEQLDQHAGKKQTGVHKNISLIQLRGKRSKNAERSNLENKQRSIEGNRNVPQENTG